MRKLTVSLFSNTNSVNPIIVKEGEVSVEVDRVEIQINDEVYTIFRNDNDNLIYEKSLNNKLMSTGMVI